MSETAELFELDNLRRFRGFWAKCTPTEQAQIYKIVREEMGEEVEETLSKKELNAQATIVIEFLNKKAGKKFRPVETHLTIIRARLQSGITVQELKSIIAMKTKEWRNTDQEQYLRPATLFAATSCENYLGNLN